MKLKVYDRLILLNLLPKEGNSITLKIVRKLREDLSFSESEHKMLEFRQEGDRVFWNKDVDDPKEIPIGEKAMDLIIEPLKKLNDTDKLPDEYLDLYEMFVEGK